MRNDPPVVGPSGQMPEISPSPVIVFAVQSSYPGSVVGVAGVPMSLPAKNALPLIASPLIERLNLGPLPTSHVQWDQPHEGNLFEFLYRRRAIQRA